MLKPKLFTTLKDYSAQKFYADLISGTIVGIVALPLAIAFGIASGVSPEKGLITAVIAGFIISALGGSRVQIGGPTGAFIVIVYGIIQEYGIDGLTIATIMAGIMLIAMGLFRVGGVIKFIPYPVVVGFTSGIAVVIFTSQIKDVFGMQAGPLPAEFIPKWIFYFENLVSVNWHSVAIALFTILIIVFWPKVTNKIPGSIIAIILATLAVQFFDIPVETIGSRFGDISFALPKPHVGHISFETISNLMQPAFTIAVLGAIESLLSATVADGMIGGRHRSNMELIAQGIANVVTPLFGGIPATGAIARTATNVKNGGRTPIAGMVHAVILLLILLFLSPMAKLIPLSCLAGILVMVAYNMSEWRSFKALFNGTRGDLMVLITTFFLTVIFDLTIAIEIGLLFSVLLLFRRLALASNIEVIKDEVKGSDSDEEVEPDTEKLKIPKTIEVYEINGPFFFGITHKFEEAVNIAHVKAPKVRIIRMRKVPFIDSTGLHHLENLFEKSRHDHIQLLLSGVNTQPMSILKNSKLFERIGEENIFENFKDAYSYALTLLPNKPNKEALKTPA